MLATALPSLDEPNAGRLTIQYCPASNEKVVENPPRFMWIPVVDEQATYVLRISSDPDFSAKTTHVFKNLPLNFFTPDQVLTPGEYHWSYTTCDEK